MRGRCALEEHVTAVCRHGNNEFLLFKHTKRAVDGRHAHVVQYLRELPCAPQSGRVEEFDNAVPWMRLFVAAAAEIVIDAAVVVHRLNENTFSIENIFSFTIVGQACYPFFTMIRSFLFVLFAVFCFAGPVLAAEEQPITGAYMSSEVVGTVRALQSGDAGQEIVVVEGEDGAVYEIDPVLSGAEIVLPMLHVGDRIIVSVIDNGDGTVTAYFVDMVRTSGLWVIAAIFAVLTIAVGMRRGVLALVGFAATIAVLFFIVFPPILSGADPIAVVVPAGILILAVNLFLAHGFTRNSLVAFASTSVGVLLAWLFATLFVIIGKMTGLADEQTMLLYFNYGLASTPSSLLLAGIILGTVGVLDDVAITQAETVAELRGADASLSRRELFVRGMRIGRHHIASTVNTLVLAYVGSSLPLFLLFLSDKSVSFSRFMNTEMVAQEVVRTLAGTTALILVVPLATFLAAWAWSRAKGASHKHGV